MAPVMQNYLLVLKKFMFLVFVFILLFSMHHLPSPQHQELQLYLLQKVLIHVDNYFFVVQVYWHIVYLKTF